MSRLCILLLAFFSQAYAMAATEIISLGFRTTDEVLPIAESMLGEDGRVKAYGNQLIVTADTDKINELRELITQLDSPPKRLLISVDTSQAGNSQDQGYQLNGGVNLGNTHLQIGQGQQHGQNQARVIQRNTQNRSGSVQQVQASEGFPALIQIGQSVPMTTQQYDIYGRPYPSTQYQNVTQGFYATARVIGDQVQVEISSHNNRLNPEQPGTINIQNTSTRVSGKLGEWLPLGQISESNANQESGLARRYSTSGRDDFSARIKVELLD